MSRLIFVYNVDASPVALLRDLYQGITTGSTDCRLCDITYGKLFKDQTWNRFVKDLPVAAEFRLRSTFLGRYPELRDREFPAVYAVDGDEPREIISAAELNQLDGLDALRELVQTRVDELVRVPGAVPAPS